MNINKIVLHATNKQMFQYVKNLFFPDMLKIHPKPLSNIERFMIEYDEMIRNTTVDPKKYDDYLTSFIAFVYKNDSRYLNHIEKYAKEFNTKLSQFIIDYSSSTKNIPTTKKEITISDIIEELDISMFTLKKVYFPQGIRKILKTMYCNGTVYVDAIKEPMKQLFYESAAKLVYNIKNFIYRNLMWNHKFVEIQNGNIFIMYELFLIAYNNNTNHGNSIITKSHIVSMSRLFMNTFNNVMLKNGTNLTNNHVVNNLLFDNNKDKQDVMRKINNHIEAFLNLHTNKFTNKIRILHTYFNGGRLELTNTDFWKDNMYEEYIDYICAMEYTITRIIEYFFRYGYNFKESNSILPEYVDNITAESDISDWEEHFYNVLVHIKNENSATKSKLCIKGEVTEPTPIMPMPIPVPIPMPTPIPIHQNPIYSYENHTYFTNSEMEQFNQFNDSQNFNKAAIYLLLDYFVRLCVLYKFKDIKRIRDAYIQGIIAYLKKEQVSLPHIHINITDNHSKLDGIRILYIEFLYILHKTFNVTLPITNIDFYISKEIPILSSFTSPQFTIINLQEPDYMSQDLIILENCLIHNLETKLVITSVTSKRVAFTSHIYQ